MRPAPQPELRLKEAAKLGFSAAVVPKTLKSAGMGMRLIGVNDVGELASFAGAESRFLKRERARIES